MIQFKSNENEWTPFQIVDISKAVESSKKSKKLSPLPSEYTSEKDLFRDSGKSEKLWAALCNVNFSGITDFQELDSAFKYEITWLEQIFDSLENYSTNDEATCNGWAAHQSSKKRGSKYPPGINTISTLTRDKVVTMNTQGHCMLGKIKCTLIQVRHWWIAVISQFFDSPRCSRTTSLYLGTAYQIVFAFSSWSTY